MAMIAPLGWLWTFQSRTCYDFGPFSRFGNQDTSGAHSEGGIMLIENRKCFDLPPNADLILRQMFAESQRVIIEEDFSSFGYSGSYIYVVHSTIKHDDAPALPSVVKIASVSVIEKEWKAYKECIHQRLPGVAEIRGEPVLPSGSDYGGLRYDLFGAGEFKIEPLKEYATSAQAQDLLFVIERQLLPSMRRMWDFGYQSQASFPLQVCYDRVLPVNLLVGPVQPPPEKDPIRVQPDDLSPPSVQEHDWVRLEGFAITKVDLVHDTVTLNAPRSGDGPPRSYVVRLQSVREMASASIGQLIPPIEGKVVETRLGRLLQEAQEALGPGIDLTSADLALPDGTTLPNPLRALPDVLSQTRHIRTSHIHGDLNLGNILVERETRKVGLIDFSEARQDYVLLDFLRLETEIITHLVSQSIRQYDLPLPSTIHQFFDCLHHISFGEEPKQHGFLHPDLQRFLDILRPIRETARDYLFDRNDHTEYYQGLVPYLLGALKFGNLDQVSKQAAFWGAAATQSILTRPLTEGPAIRQAFDELWNCAQFSKGFWPVLAGEPEWSRTRSDLHGVDTGVDEPEWNQLLRLGVSNTPTFHFRLNDRIRLIIESDRNGYLTLLDEETTGKVVCLCPSHYAPDTRLYPGRTCLPQAESSLDVFHVTGKPGKERLVAIITDEPLDLCWLPSTAASPTRGINLKDIERLLEHLQGLRENSWQVWAIGLEVQP
jgi:hypothetical protein